MKSVKLVLLLAALSLTAWGQAPEPDSPLTRVKVIFIDGSSTTGYLLELKPEEYVVLRTLNGQVIKYERSKLLSVQFPVAESSEGEPVSLVPPWQGRQGRPVAVLGTGLTFSPVTEGSTSVVGFVLDSGVGGQLTPQSLMLASVGLWASGQGAYMPLGVDYRKTFGETETQTLLSVSAGYPIVLDPGGFDVTQAVGLVSARVSVGVALYSRKANGIDAIELGIRTLGVAQELQEFQGGFLRSRDRNLWLTGFFLGYSRSFF